MGGGGILNYIILTFLREKVNKGPLLKKGKETLGILSPVQSSEHDMARLPVQDGDDAHIW